MKQLNPQTLLSPIQSKNHASGGGRGLRDRRRRAAGRSGGLGQRAVESGAAALRSSGSVDAAVRRPCGAAVPSARRPRGLQAQGGTAAGGPVTEERRKGAARLCRRVGAAAPSVRPRGVARAGDAAAGRAAAEEQRRGAAAPSARRPRGVARAGRRHGRRPRS
ncbi:hypothetical protein [Oryza sativa Japonica Group]|uniref:Uncharacterized protein n=1 Tax=Oryza sativa subsp. japonica TaxID=39947 RepID=Q5JJT7_ORYSJ|nr:hypothetical protein [Oryza sativa Japonica Group]BAD88276.1 hypothetical protein [Oryza sativa Japonica Group]